MHEYYGRHSIGWCRQSLLENKQRKMKTEAKKRITILLKFDSWKDSFPEFWFQSSLSNSFCCILVRKLYFAITLIRYADPERLHNPESFVRCWTLLLLSISKQRHSIHPRQCVRQCRSDYRIDHLSFYRIGSSHLLLLFRLCAISYFVRLQWLPTLFNPCFWVRWTPKRKRVSSQISSMHSSSIRLFVYRSKAFRFMMFVIFFSNLFSFKNIFPFLFCLLNQYVIAMIYARVENV